MACNATMQQYCNFFKIYFSTLAGQKNDFNFAKIVSTIRVAIYGFEDDIEFVLIFFISKNKFYAIAA